MLYKMTKWQTKTIEEICEQPEYGYTASASYEEIGPKFLRITDIQNNYVDWNKVPHCLYEGRGNHYLKSNDIVFARIGATTGKSYLIKNPPRAVYASYLIRLRTIPETILADYLYFYFQTHNYWKQINSNKGSSLKGGINASVLSNIIILLPPLPTQKKIAYILSTIQGKFQLIDKQIAAFEDLKKSTMERLFTKGLDGNGISNWQTKTIKVPLHELCDLQNGFAFRSKDYVPYSNTLNIRMSNIRPDNNFDIEYNPKFLPDNYAVTYKNYLLKNGDIIIAMTDMAGTPKILGVPTIVKNNSSFNLLLNQRVGKLIGIKTERVDVNYLRYFLSRHEIKKYYSLLGKRGLQVNLGKNEILSVLVTLHPLSTQKKIANILSTIDDKIQLLKNKNKIQKDLFNSMLHKLMKQKIEVENIKSSS